MSFLNVSIAQHSPLLVKVTANVSAGWSRNEKGFGFYASGSMPWPGDRGLEFTMNVRVRPYNRFDEFRTFPSDIDQTADLTWRDADGLAVFRVWDGKLGVIVAIEDVRSGLEDAVDVKSYFLPVVIKRGRECRVQMALSACVTSAPASAMGDIPEWDTQFFQGGLPSLGRRRP